MARPTKKEGLIFKIRDRKIIKMIDKNYPLPYVSTFFNLSTGRLVQIYKAYGQKEEKYAAQAAVTNAIKCGKLKRKVCEVCGSSKTDAHHYLGYKKKNWLKVKWFCRKHHNKIHSEKEKAEDK